MKEHTYLTGEYLCSTRTTLTSFMADSEQPATIGSREAHTYLQSKAYTKQGPNELWALPRRAKA